MKNNIYIIILIFSFVFPSKIIKICEKRIKELFSDSISINHNIYEITDQDKKTYDIVNQVFFKDELNVWTIKESSDSIHYYYGVLDNIMGKTMPISFLSIFNEDGSVFDVSVIIKLGDNTYEVSK